MAVPELRFRREDGTDYPEWEEKRLGDFFLERNERAIGCEELLSVTISNGVIRQADSDKRNASSSDKSNYKIVRKGDMPYNSMRMWQGAFGVSAFDGIVSPAYTVLVPKENCYAVFFGYLFKLDSTLHIFTRFSQGLASDTWNLKYPALSDLKFFIPCLEEQQKIASFLSDLDAVISASEAEVAALEQQKKGLMQKIFSREVRFRRDDGAEYPEWEEKKLGDVFEISTEKNDGKYGIDGVLSVSDEYGVVNQIEFHGRSFAGESIENYKVVRPGQIVYTRSPLALKPYGIIKFVKNVSGVVSPLYIVNNAKFGNDSLFWYYNFDSPDRTNRYLKPIVRAGAKHTMNVSHEEWLSGTVFAPCLEEQRKIASLLSDMDAAIDLAKRELAQWKLLKKGLMQRMFV